MINLDVSSWQLPAEVENVLNNSDLERVQPENRNDLIELAFGRKNDPVFEVGYDVPGTGYVVEANVTRCRNGASVNYPDIYMRRRDPDCMVVADQGDTDKVRYHDRFGDSFDDLRRHSLEWLKNQPLLVLPFMAGGLELGYQALLIAPVNAGFFAGGLADLQGFLKPDEVPEGFKPKAIIYLAPPFRHTHFDGKQIVVHNRLDQMHELFSFNLYPGPSAKKGIYGVLLNIGESEGWVTAHASTVRVITPYDNQITIMHEGASGGGKSEMIEQIHREDDGRVLLGNNTVTLEKLLLELKDTCALQPVTDDMAFCHPDIQNDSGRLVVQDAEQGWFLRIDHITNYGTDPHYEKACIQPQEPLIFLNLDAQPHATCLLWEPVMDEPGKPCPNPRVIMPRKLVNDVVNEAVEVDIRSFGVRSPACTKENPSYGIIGMLHILPPALAWLWRLVTPRGHQNPSITESSGMTCEGVGSYWAFGTGKMVEQANLLLKQITATPGTRYILVPNQHIGAYKTGFVPQWLTREFLARRGGVRFRSDQLSQARSPLLGFVPNSIKIDGFQIPQAFIQVDRQPEVGSTGYDAGARILNDFFKKELSQFLTADLDPLGRKIIEACLSDQPLERYIELTPYR
jgi:hypothetical protein